MVDTPEDQPGSESISQDDIDALLGGSGVGDLPELSPDDLNALLSGGATDGAAGPSAEMSADAPDATGDTTDSDAAPQAADAEPAAAAPPRPRAAPASPETFSAQELTADAGLGVDPKKVTMLSDVKLRVKIQLGKTRMLVEDVLKLGEGSVVELDKLAGDPVDVLVNDRLVARGEVLVLNDNFCVRVSEVLSHDPHRITT